MSAREAKGKAKGNSRASGKSAIGSAKAARKVKSKTLGPEDGWQARVLAEIRRLIQQADPQVVEQRKWKKAGNPSGVPVWCSEGIVCTGESYQRAVKLTFARGAALDDPQGLFNASLEGSTRRAIDIREGESIDPEAFKALIRAAVAENLRWGGGKNQSSSKSPAQKPAVAARKASPPKKKRSEKVVLLSGGNPQVEKGNGDAPVQAYIAAMPGWKREVGQRIDALIVRTVPGVRKAVKWNSPFYGIEGRGWFATFHVFTRYVKATFFSGTSLRPVPPGGTPKSKEARWIDIYEDQGLDEAQMASWVKQAAAIPGWNP